MNRAVVIVSSNDDIGVPLWHALERAQIRAQILAPGAGVQEALRARVLAQSETAWGVVVDMTAGVRQSVALIRELRAAAPELLILAAMAAGDVRAAQAVIEAGAWDYLIHPFDAEQIEAVMRLWDTAAIEASQPGRVICFLPARAGDGASTVALHVADAIAHAHQGRGFARKVLLVDLDFQAGDLAFRLRLDSTGTPDAEIEPQADSPLLLRKSVCGWRELDVLASARARSVFRAGDARRVAGMVSAAKAAYPLVVADMPPAMYSSSREVLGLADEVFVVCTPEIASVHLARRRVEELDETGVARERVRLVLNRAGSHDWIGREEVGLAAGLPVSALLANDYRGVSAAVLEGGVVSRRSVLGRQFLMLGREVLRERGRVAVAASA